MDGRNIPGSGQSFGQCEGRCTGRGPTATPGLRPRGAASQLSNGFPVRPKDDATVETRLDQVARAGEQPERQVAMAADQLGRRMCDHFRPGAQRTAEQGAKVWSITSEALAAPPTSASPSMSASRTSRFRVSRRTRPWSSGRSPRGRVGTGGVKGPVPDPEPGEFSADQGDRPPVYAFRQGDLIPGCELGQEQGTLGPHPGSADAESRLGPFERGDLRGEPDGVGVPVAGVDETRCAPS